MDRATGAWGQWDSSAICRSYNLTNHFDTTRCNAPGEHSFNLLNHFEDPEAGPSASPPVPWCPERFPYIKGHAEWASIRMAEKPFFL